MVAYKFSRYWDRSELISDIAKFQRDRRADYHKILMEKSVKLTAANTRTLNAAKQIEAKYKNAVGKDSKEARDLETALHSMTMSMSDTDEELLEKERDYLSKKALRRETALIGDRAPSILGDKEEAILAKLNAV